MKLFTTARVACVVLSGASCVFGFADDPEGSAQRTALIDDPNPGPLVDYQRSGPIVPAPSNLVVQKRTVSTIELSFTCGGNADWHEAYGGIPGTTSSRIAREGLCISTPGVIRHADLKPETNYCYFVRAGNKTTQVNTSPLVCATTTAPTTAPQQPSVWLRSASTNRIDVVIRDNSTETYFEIRRRRVGEADFTLLATINRSTPNSATGEHLTRADTGLWPNTTYEYRVHAGYTSQAGTTLTSAVVYASAKTQPATYPGDASACTDATVGGPCMDKLTVGSVEVRYLRNYPLNVTNTAITRVVFVVHGKNRTVWNAFTNMIKAAKGKADLGEANVHGETLIVAPYFESGRWPDTWQQGGDSVTSMFIPAVSSFTVADQFLAQMTNLTRFPNVQEVVVAGHSAGGQFTHRYALTTAFEKSRPALRFRYVIANPGSFTYLDATRRDLLVPADAASCPNYNKFKYGLENRSGYVGTRTNAEILSWYTGRNVTYLAGKCDRLETAPLDPTCPVNDPGDDFTSTCEANLQGPDRYSRAVLYYGHVMHKLRLNRHRLTAVSGVGHSSEGMYTSRQGRDSLFF